MEDRFFFVRKHGIPIPVFQAFLAVLADRYDGPFIKEGSSSPERWWNAKVARMANLRARGKSWRTIAKKYGLEVAEAQKLVADQERIYTEKNEALIGQVFGERVVTRYLGRDERGRARWEVKCLCGKRQKITLSNMKKTLRCLSCTHKKRTRKRP